MDAAFGSTTRLLIDRTPPLRASIWVIVAVVAATPTAAVMIGMMTVIRTATVVTVNATATHTTAAMIGTIGIGIMAGKGTGTGVTVVALLAAVVTPLITEGAGATQGVHRVVAALLPVLGIMTGRRPVQFFLANRAGEDLRLRIG